MAMEMAWYLAKDAVLQRRKVTSGYYVHLIQRPGAEFFRKPCCHFRVYIVFALCLHCVYIVFDWVFRAPAASTCP